MKQLPGRQAPRWLRFVVTAVMTTVATIWLFSLLPFLLLLSVVFGIVLIPVLRQLRQEMDGMNVEPEAKSPPVDVTPWHRQLSLLLAQLRNRSLAMRR